MRRTKLMRRYQTAHRDRSDRAAKVPTSERGTATLGITVAERFRRKRKITMDDQTNSEHQHELHVGHGGSNGSSSIGQDHDMNRCRQRGSELTATPSSPNRRRR